MKAKIAELVAALRRAEVPVSVAESMDAAQAAALVGVERQALRDALAAALVKDERDRPVFLAAFAAVFPPRPADVATAARRKRRRQAARSGTGEPAAGGGAGGATQPARAAFGEAVRAPGSATGATSETPSRSLGAPSEGRDDPEPPDRERARELRRSGDAEGAGSRVDADRTAAEETDAGDARHARGAAGDAAGAIAAARHRTAEEDGIAADAVRRLRARSLARLSFRAMDPAEVEAAAELARAIAERVQARVRRRLAPRPTGRLDFRRTIRAAVPHGGIPFERRYRGRRPAPPDLVALSDLSASTAVATQFFLSLLAPAAVHLRHVHLFGFVDRLVEIEFVGGQVRPAEPIDLMARSDFGRVLQDLTRDHGAVLGADTVLLVLGDARNNRLPPRADLLGAARARVRRLLWLNPDPPERWNTGDSVIAAYAKHADAVVACGTLAELDRALTIVTRW